MNDTWGSGGDAGNNPGPGQWNNPADDGQWGADPAGRQGHAGGHEGYPAAPQGHPAGRQGYPAAQQGYPASQQGYPATRQDYAVPQGGGYGGPGGPGGPAGPVPGGAPGGAPAKSRRRWWPLIVVAVVLVAALVAGGLLYRHSQRDAPPGPLGWSADDVADKTDGGDFTDCDFGDDFYESVGIRDSEVHSPEKCTGTVHAGTARIPVDITTTEAKEADVPDDAGAADLPGLEDWKMLRTSTGGDGEWWDNGAACNLYGRGSLKGVHLRATGDCAFIAPAARQLSNLAKQYEFDTTDHDLFDFSSPEYIEVGTADGKADTEEFSKRLANAKPREEEVDPDTPDFPGSGLKLNEFETVADTGSGKGKICAHTTYRLGEDVNDAPHFSTPKMWLMAPTGEVVKLIEPRSSYRMSPGDTHDIDYCGQTFRSISGEFDAVLIVFPTDTSGSFSHDESEDALASETFWKVPVKL